MTVKELKEKLETMDENLEIYISDYSGFCEPITSSGKTNIGYIKAGVNSLDITKPAFVFNMNSNTAFNEFIDVGEIDSWITEDIFDSCMQIFTEMED